MRDHAQQLKAAIVAIVLLAIVLAIFTFLFPAPQPQPSPQAQNGSQLDQNGIRIPPPQPPATASDTVAVQNTQPFQLLISYVNSGFEPSDVTVKQGETVRFTNNSTGELWVAASGSQLYPNTPNGCGSSALDSCGPVEPGYFWQFTFTQKGTWSFYNNLNKSDVGTVTVTVQ